MTERKVKMCKEIRVAERRDGYMGEIKSDRKMGKICKEKEWQREWIDMWGKKESARNVRYVG